MPELAPEPLVRRVGVELGEDELAPSRVSGTGRSTSWSTRSLTTCIDSLSHGSWSRPSRAPSSPSSASGETTPPKPIRAAPALGEREQPGAEPGRDEVERLEVGVLDPRALHERVEVEDVDEHRAAPVGGRGDRPRELLLPERAR